MLMLPQLVPAFLILWTLYAVYDWPSSERVGRELESFNSPQGSTVISRDAVTHYPKGIEGVKITEVKTVHEEGGFRKQYKDGKEVLEWVDPSDRLQEVVIGCFVRCTKTKNLLPPSLTNKALDNFVAQRYNLYFYNDLGAVMAKFGQDIRRFEVNPSLSKRDKFSIIEYLCKSPLFGVGHYLEESETEAAQQQIMSVLSTNYFLKHAFILAGLLFTYLVCVADSNPHMPPVVRAAQKMIR